MCFLKEKGNSKGRRRIKRIPGMGEGYMLVFVSVWEEEVDEVEDKVWWGRIKEGDGSVFKWALFLGLYFYLSSAKAQL